MNALLLAALVTIAAPPTPAYPDQVEAVYYAGDLQHLPQIAITTAGSASASIYLASWSLTDTRVSTALVIAATSGKSVNVALDLTGGSNTAQHQVARALTAAGCNVYNVAIPHLIANNFLEADGVYTLKGNYTWNATAVQIGKYVLAISGTATAADSVATFETLIGTETLIRRTDASAPAPYTCLLYRGSRSGTEQRSKDDARPRTDYGPIAKIPRPRTNDDGQPHNDDRPRLPTEACPQDSQWPTRSAASNRYTRLRSCLAPPLPSASPLVPRYACRRPR